jgi:DNA-binding transcriptional LysR family regulator
MDRHAAMRVFVKVAELQSFTRAAEQLGIPKATATTAVQDLEALVQAKLLNRTTRTVKLTTEGASFLERCKDVLHDIEEMESMFQTGSAQIKGKIRIDMVSSLARDVLIPNLPKFLEAHPAIEIEIVGSDQKLDLIREGIDCAIRGGPLEPGLAAIHLNWGEVKTVNVVSPSYIQRFGWPTSLEDLANHRLVQYVQNFGQTPDGFEYFDGEKTRQIKMKSVITVASVDAYKAAGLAGLGILQNPFLGVRGYLKSGALLEVLPKFRPAPGRGAKIVYPQRRYLAKRVRAFIEWVEPVLQAYFTGQDST